jgi:hypothetical protein
MCENFGALLTTHMYMYVYTYNSIFFAYMPTFGLTCWRSLF